MVTLLLPLFIFVTSLTAACYGADGGLNVLNLDHYWEQFKLTHGKQYNARTGEEAGRKKTFEKNVMTILQHNLEADLNLRSYKLGVNQYADMSDKEFRQKMMGLKAPTERPRALGTHKAGLSADVPKHIDWTTVPGVVGDVKDQGSCGSCWTFSTIGAVEAAIAINKSMTLVLSEQQLVDCIHNETLVSNGCNGGLMTEGFQYIAENGVAALAEYPYVSGETHEAGDICNYTADMEKGRISGFVEIPRGSEKALEHAVGTIGPVSVAIDAGSLYFRFYTSGVYDDFFCFPDSLNHGVIAVGYGTTLQGQDYWKVRNSWSADWGFEGYILMAKGKNLCGISEMASYPVV